MDKGLLHIYTGDGKGKTTSAFGLALRAYASGMRVYIVQFLKPMPSAETRFIQKLDDNRFSVFCFEQPHGFVFEHEPIRADILNTVDFINRVYERSECDMLVLDEIICAYKMNLIDENELRRIINARPNSCELVLTGRGAPEWLVKEADYVTEMSLIKHPFERGIQARRGIEY